MNGYKSLTKDTITEFSIPDMKRKKSVDSQVKTEDSSSSVHTLISKTEGDKMKLAILNLLGGWKEDG